MRARLALFLPHPQLGVDRCTATQNGEPTPRDQTADIVQRVIVIVIAIIIIIVIFIVIIFRRGTWTVALALSRLSSVVRCGSSLPRRGLVAIVRGHVAQAALVAR